MKKVLNRTLAIATLTVATAWNVEVRAESSIGIEIPAARLINSEGTVIGQRIETNQYFYKKLNRPAQELPPQLRECFTPRALTDHAVFGDSTCGHSKDTRIGIFRMDSKKFQEIEIGEVIEIRTISNTAVLAHRYLSSAHAFYLIDEDAVATPYRFLRTGEKSLREDPDGLTTSDQPLLPGLADDGGLFVGLYSWDDATPIGSRDRFRKIVRDGTIQDFSPWWDADAYPIRSEHAHITAHVKFSDKGKREQVLLHDLNSGEERALDLPITEGEGKTLTGTYQQSPVGMLYGRDGYLYSNKSRPSEYDGGYLNAHPVRINPEHNEQLDLSCSIPPQRGRLIEIIGTSSNGYVLASTTALEMPYYPITQLLLSPEELTAHNYCANVTVSLTKSCSGRLRHDKYLRHLYKPRGVVKKSSCSAVLTFTDSQHQPIVGARVELKAASYGREYSKTPARTRAKTDSAGTAKIKLTRALRRPGICGWNVLLNSSEFQPNGISLRGVAPDSYRCKLV